MMKIRDLAQLERESVRAVAEMLAAAFATQDWPGAFSDIDENMAEIVETLQPGRISRIAVADDGSVLGWVAAEQQYSHAWEMHPLAVHPDYRRQGIGRALLVDLEERVAERGGLTIFLGSDDETDMTSLSGVDLYDDPAGHIGRIENRHGHPYEFYQKCGYTIVGVIPDANGRGRPDIIMAKRVDQAA